MSILWPYQICYYTLYLRGGMKNSKKDKKISAALAKSLGRTSESRRKKIFYIFSLRQNFFVYTKIKYLQTVLIFPKNVNFRPKISQKLVFADFFSCCTSYFEANFFCCYQNIISSTVQRNHGGGAKKRYGNDQTTSKKQTNTTGDQDTPAEYFQNPWANTRWNVC